MLFNDFGPETKKTEGFLGFLIKKPKKASVFLVFWIPQLQVTGQPVPPIVQILGFCFFLVLKRAFLLFFSMFFCFFEVFNGLFFLFYWFLLFFLFFRRVFKGSVKKPVKTQCFLAFSGLGRQKNKKTECCLMILLQKPKKLKFF